MASAVGLSTWFLRGSLANKQMNHENHANGNRLRALSALGGALGRGEMLNVSVNEPPEIRVSAEIFKISADVRSVARVSLLGGEPSIQCWAIRLEFCTGRP
jgi:hypothetical protein